MATLFVEKILKVAEAVEVKRTRTKEYRYRYGALHVRLPSEFVGRKVKVIVIPLSE